MSRYSPTVLPSGAPTDAAGDIVRALEMMQQDNRQKRLDQWQEEQQKHQRETWAAESKQRQLQDALTRMDLVNRGAVTAAGRSRVAPRQIPAPVGPRQNIEVLGGDLNPNGQVRQMGLAGVQPQAALEVRDLRGQAVRPVEQGYISLGNVGGEDLYLHERDLPRNQEKAKQQQIAEWLRGHGIDVPNVEGLDTTPFVQTAVQQGRKEAERASAIETLTRAYVSHGMPEARARALAEVGAGGLQLQPYQPITREEQFRDLREKTGIEAGARSDAGVNWQTVQTESGFVQINPRTGQVRPLASQSGDPLRPKTNTPAWVPKAVAANQRQVSVIDNALRLLQEYPKGVGWSKGFSDAVNQRTDPRGIALRAAISDVGSLEIRDRSGAAVTAAEFPRLAPFIPNAGDTPEAVRIKLERMRQIVADENDFLQQGGVTQPSMAPGGEYSPDNPFASR